jgi:hypothetical protein
METEWLVVTLIEHRRLTGHVLAGLAELSETCPEASLLPLLIEHLRTTDLQLHDAVGRLVQRPPASS